ncbi:MAG: amidohydrolase family protein [Nitrospirota bacterium]
MSIIDIHVHGLGGYDVRTSDEEHLLRIAELQAAAGVDEIVLTLYPSSVPVMREQMRVVKRAMERQEDGNALSVTSDELKNKEESLDALRITHHSSRSSNAARIVGVHLEGPFLNPAKCGALNAMTFLEPAEYRLEELLEGFEDMVRIVTVAPELKGAAGLIRALADRGIVASMGHSDATYAEAEAGFNAGAKGITHLFNAMRGFHHREPGLAGFGLMNPEVYVEVIADPYHLHPGALELVLKAKRPDRVILVSDMVRESKSSSRTEAVADRHGSLIGGSMSITEAAERLVALGCGRSAAMDFITGNPARYIGRSE